MATLTGKRVTSWSRSRFTWVHDERVVARCTSVSHVSGALASHEEVERGELARFPNLGVDGLDEAGTKWFLDWQRSGEKINLYLCDNGRTGERWYLAVGAFIQSFGGVPIDFQVSIDDLQPCDQPSVDEFIDD